MARELMMAEWQAGMVISAAAFVSFVASPLWGRRVDKTGSKQSLILGVAGYAIFNMAFAFVLWLATGSTMPVIAVFMLLVLTRCLFAFFSAAIMPAAQTHLISQTTAEERPAKLAMIGMMFGLGMIIGPAVGSAMVSAGILVPIVFSALIMLLPLPFAVGRIVDVKFQPNQSGNRDTLRFNDVRMRPFIVLMVVIYAIFSAIQQTIAFSLQDLLSFDAVKTAQWVGIAFMISAVTSVVCQGGVIQKWRFTGSQMIAVGLSALLLALAIFFFATNLVSVMMAFAILGVGLGFAYPGVISKASLAFPSQLQGQVTATLQAAMSLGFIIGPLMGAGLYAEIGIWVYSVLLLFLVIALVYLMLNRDSTVEELA
ncbi:MFS transporter [Photobacterium aquae]|nr:MFS transporter [Photobacterium aquae]